MKVNFNKFGGLCLTAMAALFLATAFTACSDDDDDETSTSASSSESSSVAVYKLAEGSYVQTMTFYADNTVVLHIEGTRTVEGSTISADFDFMTGTYTGAPAADGEITVKWTNKADRDAVLQEAKEAGETSVTVKNSNCPFIAIEYPTAKSITITNGELTFYADAVFIRQ